ncbi:hypothetical protein FGO68_gene4398 [Halteria grandinella]|uniref:Uncharacterized protein n=1 Tax=Halteria grandinella TaxID=5974 RepID=A0A8J8NCQ2_HALGN|nr:hypothetical protein FGO68_gene4398 [Halteria grandinella]
MFGYLQQSRKAILSPIIEFASQDEAYLCPHSLLRNLPFTLLSSILVLKRVYRQMLLSTPLQSDLEVLQGSSVLSIDRDRRYH